MVNLLTTSSFISTKSADHILWFFSTCAQTFAALVSVFGMFVLYRLQIEEGRIGALRERMFRHDEHFARLPFDVVVQNLQTLEQGHRQNHEHDLAQNIRTLLQHYKGATGKRSQLSSQARAPVIGLVVLTFWSLTGLVVYPYYAVSVWGFAWMWITLVACLVPFYQIASLIVLSLSVE